MARTAKVVKRGRPVKKQAVKAAKVGRPKKAAKKFEPAGADSDEELREFVVNRLEKMNEQVTVKLTGQQFVALWYAMHIALLVVKKKALTEALVPFESKAAGMMMRGHLIKMQPIVDDYVHKALWTGRKKGAKKLKLW